jgi:retinol dehydrogenase-12
MKGKLCLVTGASSGIGKITARELAKKGATVVLLCRSREKGEAVLAELRQISSEPHDLLIADLSSQRDIRRVAAEYRQKYSKLHVLVNNAGLLLTERKTTVDGLEETFATNHIGYFLLTTLLLDIIKASAPARIVNVSSEAHRAAKLNLQDLHAEQGYSSFRVYANSKLANILFTRALAKRLEGTGVTTNCLHPGVVQTGFGKNNSGFFGFLVKIGGFFMISPEKGAETSIFLASDPSVEGVSGKYFDKCRERTPTRIAQDDITAEALWRESERLVAKTA